MYYFRFFLLINSALLFTAYVAFGLDINMAPYAYIYTLLVNIYMLLQSRKNFLIFIVFFIILFSNYSIVYSNFIAKFDNTIFTDILDTKSTNISLNILTLFSLFLFLFVKWSEISPNPPNNIFINERYQRTWDLFILVFILIFVFFLGFTLPEKEGLRGSPSPLYEYSLIFFAIYFYFRGYRKVYVIIGLILITAYSLQNFIFGGRILGVQFLLCAYIMLFMHQLRMSIVVTAIILMFFMMSIVGVVRGELLSGNFDVDTILTSLFESGFALDTAYSAYYTSESFVYVLDKFSTQEILIFSWEFVKSIFIGSDPDMLLTSISETYIKHYGGGILPFYFYFYFGLIGILLSACLVALYLNLVIRLNKHSSGYLKCLSVWIVSTTFRWYLYSPLPLLRGVLFLTIAYYVFAYLHYQINRLSIFQNLSNETEY